MPFSGESGWRMSQDKPLAQGRGQGTPHVMLLSGPKAVSRAKAELVWDEQD